MKMAESVNVELTEKQSLKLEAEIEKLKTETARANEDGIRAAEKHDWDRRLFELNLEKSGAELSRFKAEVESFVLVNEGTRMNVEREREKREIERASDHFFYCYYLDHDISEESVRRCMAKLQTWRRSAPEGKKIEIELVINSRGGDVVSGLALYDFLESIKRSGHRVVTGALGVAASMGSILLQAGDVRYMGRGANILIHEVSTVAWGKTSEIEDRMSLIKKFQERSIDIYVNRSGGKLSRELVASEWKRRDWWLTADQCMELGLIDEIR